MINEFLKDIETVIDIRFNMNRETEKCNHSYVLKLHQEEYIPAKEKLESTIKILLTDI